jgi:hypothetical protein
MEDDRFPYGQNAGPSPKHCTLFSACVHGWQSALLGEFNDQVSVGHVRSACTNNHSIRMLARDEGEGVVIVCWSMLCGHHFDSQLPAGNLAALRPFSHLLLGIQNGRLRFGILLARCGCAPDSVACGPRSSRRRAPGCRLLAAALSSAAASLSGPLSGCRLPGLPHCTLRGYRRGPFAPQVIQISLPVFVRPRFDDQMLQSDDTAISELAGVVKIGPCAQQIPARRKG